MSDDELARARRELAASKLLVDNGFGAQAVSRAYFAAFYAAEDALSALGETRSKHSGVISAFGRLVVREHGAREAVTDANAVVDAVHVWLRSRERAAGDS